MTPSTRCQPVVIFEGPDAGGKSTAAQLYAKAIDGLYVHHAPYLYVKHGLARVYLESMLPALMGYQPVVLDRSWLSEPIYGSVMRQGHDRIGLVHRRMLERAALRCGAMVINCLPPWPCVDQTYQRRHATEYVNTKTKMKQVYNIYTQLAQQTDLSVTQFSYVKHPSKAQTLAAIRTFLTGASTPHLTSCRSAGALNAKIVLVGDQLAEVKAHDNLYQLPFISWSNHGCSSWLTAQLAKTGLKETQLLYVNAHDQSIINFFAQFTQTDLTRKQFIALGSAASTALTRQGIKHLLVPHPQHWKRFQAQHEYPLLSLITQKGALQQC